MRDDATLARMLAEIAATQLLRLRDDGALSGVALGQAGDRIANDAILERLSRERPRDAFLSEESPDGPTRLASERVWIIDPLDGTREYREGRDDFAVHVALAIGGKPSVAAVALPALGRVFTTHPPAVIEPMAASDALQADRLRIVVSRTRPAEIANRIATTLNAELIPMGSAGAKAMAVVRGFADAYIHVGEMREWDACAPIGVALAAGLHASRIDGETCVFNRTECVVPDLLICRTEVADRLLGAICA